MTRIFTARSFAAWSRVSFSPRRAPADESSEKSVRRSHTQTLAQRASENLAIHWRKCCLYETGRTDLGALLKRCRFPIVPMPKCHRISALLLAHRERRARMIEQCAQPGSESAKKTQKIWIPLFTPPPPPTYIHKEEFAKTMGQATKQHFNDVATAVQKLQAGGSKKSFSLVFQTAET